MAAALDTARAAGFCERVWEQEILPQLDAYIRIPNRSPLFDPGWREAGHMDRAVALVEAWCRRQPIPGLTVEVVRLPDRTPLLFLEAPATGGHPASDTVLLYGHLDKQPEFVGWREGLDPWTPVREGDRLYGRGGADDGYAAFASLAALRLLAEEGRPRARCVVMIEAGEESGSPDLPAYIEALAPRIGQPRLVVCLDSGCASYDQLWMTTSLRGMIAGTLRVDILREGVHSGEASGVVPSSFRILRRLLDRIEDADSGRIKLDELWVEVPPERLAQARATAALLGRELFSHYPFVEGARPMVDDPVEALLGRTWRPTLSVTGADGLPPSGSAGNVLRPYTTAMLSFRVPPRASAERAAAALQRVLEADPPSGARVRFTGVKAADGWDAPPLSPWLAASVERASQAFFGQPAMAMGEGGTIPFMGLLGQRFPAAQFLITGVLGPHSNAHGPNEFLHIPTAKRLTACVAQVLADQADAATA